MLLFSTDRSMFVFRLGAWSLERDSKCFRISQERLQSSVEVCLYSKCVHKLGGRGGRGGRKGRGGRDPGVASSVLWIQPGQERDHPEAAFDLAKWPWLHKGVQTWNDFSLFLELNPKVKIPLTTLKVLQLLYFKIHLACGSFSNSTWGEDKGSPQTVCKEQSASPRLSPSSALSELQTASPLWPEDGRKNRMSLTI